MRVLHVVAGEKWTGVAAVVFDWTRALVESGIEAQFAFVGASPLGRRILPIGWARPLLSRAHGPQGIRRDWQTLRATLERERFDVLHAHLSHDHYLAAAAVRGTRVGLARTIHHLKQARRDPASRALFRRTEAFAFGNRAIASAFGADGPVHSPVVDPIAFAPDQKPRELMNRIGLRRDAWILGTVGKMARGRGHEEAMDAAAPLSAEVVLLHVGKGELQPALAARAAAAGTADRNLWVGYQDEALPLYYRAMDVFVFTASGSQQGQRAILEAMASGLPVAALDVPGVRELITDGVEGFVARDVPGLTEALRRLREDPTLYAQMASAARRRAAEFSGKAFAAAASAFYAAIRSRPESPRGVT